MSALKDAGSLVASIGNRAWLMTMGVIFPGLLISCELIWLYVAWNFPTEAIIPLALSKLASLTPLSSFLFVAIGLAVACGVGYLNRDATFAVSNTWLQWGMPPCRPLSSVMNQLRFIHGSDAIDRVAGKYGVFSLTDDSKDAAAKLPRSAESYVREFCKLWLSAKAPTLTTVGTEIEINGVIGLVTPIALAGLVILASLHTLLGALLGGLALVSAIFLLYRVNSSRVMETENAILNFMFAHWEALPASSLDANKDSPSGE
ncbi:hypothetical protein IVB34_01715 [Bradyrhizobium sp. 2]|uniref:hypothetical protein n=1 Tax=Bradyrhizobium sp. 2 TaxID=190045 RepID=UPI001FFACA71|nr:hypothetical protein [Bradyrhizobium sp. 2]MCK1457110.1 hypothetical protein [Bradyrhizobium sp. 2]